jgi:AraC-like DNA-binding protein
MVAVKSLRKLKSLNPLMNFRNEWSVEHAKSLIMEGKSSELTLEAIGILSGFSSRNTFLHAFKKVEGISPHTYLSRFMKK